MLQSRLRQSALRLLVNRRTVLHSRPARLTNHHAFARALSAASHPATFASDHVQDHYTQAHKKFVGFAEEGGVRHEYGRLAPLASSSVVSKKNNAMVLTTAVSVPPSNETKEAGQMMVDFKDKGFAGGLIPSNPGKRERAPKERDVLISRVVDRSIRPLVDETFRGELQVVTTLLSTDPSVDLETLSINSAAIALLSSKEIPLDAAFAATRVALIDGQFVCNPPFDQLKNHSDLDLLYVGTRDKCVMIESSCNNVATGRLENAMMMAQQSVARLVDQHEEIAHGYSEKVGRPVVKWTPTEKLRVTEPKWNEFEHLIAEGTKIYEKQSNGEFLTKHERQLAERAFVQRNIREIQSSELLDKILTRSFTQAFWESNGSVRCDGRSPGDLRDISMSAGVLPSAVHGSARFERGNTQCLATVTLGTTMIDAVREQGYSSAAERKNFYLHYSFPPYSVNETGNASAVNRRMIGHGALAEKALAPVIPPLEKYPYSIRVTSETTASDGSSSMAAVSGSTLALRNAGVPISDLVAGISVGVLQDRIDPSQHSLILDILGVEDHRGLMDFKVAGTKTGITALQLDIKATGIPLPVLTDALKLGHTGVRNIIEMMEATPQPVNDSVPHVRSIKIPLHQTGNVIGARHETRMRLEQAYGGKVEVDTEMYGDGFAAVNVYHSDKEVLKALVSEVQELASELVPGNLYHALVTDVQDHGAQVSLGGNVQAYLPLSQIQDGPIESATEALKVSDEFEVLCLSSDERGVRVSRKGGARVVKSSFGLHETTNTTSPNLVSVVEVSPDANATETIHYEATPRPLDPPPSDKPSAPKRKPEEPTTSMKFDPIPPPELAPKRPQAPEKKPIVHALDDVTFEYRPEKPSVSSPLPSNERVKQVAYSIPKETINPTVRRPGPIISEPVTISEPVAISEPVTISESVTMSETAANEPQRLVPRSLSDAATQTRPERFVPRSLSDDIQAKGEPTPIQDEVPPPRPLIPPVRTTTTTDSPAAPSPRATTTDSPWEGEVYETEESLSSNPSDDARRENLTWRSTGPVSQTREAVKVIDSFVLDSVRNNFPRVNVGKPAVHARVISVDNDIAQLDMGDGTVRELGIRDTTLFYSIPDVKMADILSAGDSILVQKFRTRATMLGVWELSDITSKRATIESVVLDSVTQLPLGVVVRVEPGMVGFVQYENLTDMYKWMIQAGNMVGQVPISLVCKVSNQDVSLHQVADQDDFKSAGIKGMVAGQRMQLRRRQNANQKFATGGAPTLMVEPRISFRARHGRSRARPKQRNKNGNSDENGDAAGLSMWQRLMRTIGL